MYVGVFKNAFFSPDKRKIPVAHVSTTTITVAQRE